MEEGENVYLTRILRKHSRKSKIELFYHLKKFFCKQWASLSFRRKNNTIAIISNNGIDERNTNSKSVPAVKKKPEQFRELLGGIFQKGLDKSYENVFYWHKRVFVASW